MADTDTYLDAVRRDLDAWEAAGEVAFLGADGPRRFAATQQEADRALDHFLQHRLEAFGTYEDAVLHDDPWMAHSLVSAPLIGAWLDRTTRRRAALAVNQVVLAGALAASGSAAKRIA